MNAFRHLTGILLTLLAASTLSAQTYINQDFSGASGSTPPTGWTNNIISGSTSFDFWVFDNPASRTLTSPLSSPSAIFDSDWNSSGGGAENVALESPSFTVSSGATVTFEFDHYWNADFGGGKGYIEVYNGSTWIKLDSFVNETNNPQAQSYDISTYVAGKSTGKIRFRYTGDYSDFWIVDNVKVYTPIPNDLTIVALNAPTSGCGFSTSEAIKVTIYHNGTNTIPVGDTIPLAYSWNGGSAQVDTLFLTSSLLPGNTIQYTFGSTLNLTGNTNHTLKVWTAHPHDPYNNNDSNTFEVKDLRISSFPWVENFDSYTSGGGNFGSWKNLTTDSDDWLVQSGATSTNTTGPSSDNTSGSGKYIYIEASNGNYMNVLLELPCVDLAALNNPALSFYYHMYGSSIGNLFVQVNSGGGWITVDSIKGQQQTSSTEAWRQKFVDLGAFSGKVVTLRLRGVTGGSFNSDMAIDDVTIFEWYHKDVAVNEHVSGPWCPGSNPVKITLANFGSDTLFNTTINWEVNGVAQTPYSFSDTLTFNKISDTITLGNYSFSSSQVYNLRFYTSGVNSSGDENNVNDTLTLDSFGVALAGTYTIGGSGADYASPATAVNDLVTFGVCGAVTFEITAGTYAGQITIPEIAGVSSVNNVTFKSTTGDSSSVIISYDATGTADNYVLRLNGADHVTFSSVTLKSLDSSFARILVVQNGATNNVFQNNYFNAPYTGSSSAEHYVIFSGAGNDANNSFVGNRITGGSYGFYWYGTSATILESGTTIEGNYLDNYSYHIRVYFQEKPVIKNNYIKPMSSASSVFGIFAGYSHNGAVITGNTILFPGVNGYGIYLSYSDGKTGDTALVANNFISIGGNGISYGFYSSFSSFVNFYYNSVNLTSTHSTDGRAVAVSGTGSAKINLVNNIMANKGGGYAFHVPSAQASAIIKMDHNNLYSPGNNIGFWGGDVTNSISTWKSTTGMDANSVSIDPEFRSNYNLHVRSIAMNNLGTAFSAVTTDIDGQSRSTSTPDIGADEYTPAIKDLETVKILPLTAGCGDSNTVVRVVVKNLGTASQSTVPLVAEISGDINTTLSQTFIRTMTTFDVDTFSFSSTLNTYAGANISIKAYTNLSGDEARYNDTITANAAIKAIPDAPTAQPVFICKPSAVTLSATAASGLTIKWFDVATGGTAVATGSNWVTSTISQTTTYYVEASNSNTGCISPRTAVQVVVAPTPIAGFNVTDGCMNNGITFTNTSTISGGNLFYRWNFGDNNFSVDTIPVHNYAATGTYTVKLTVISDKGCEDSVSKSVTINPLPTVNFTANDVCFGKYTDFTGSGSVPGGSIVKHFWRFGDGNSLISTAASHRYAAAGTYDASLILTTDKGCTDSLVQQVEVYEMPTAKWTYTTGPTGSVSFIADEQNFANYKWYFGDGDSSASKNPVHTFSTNRDYLVVLNVSSIYGCSNSTTDTLAIINASVNDKKVSAISFEAMPNPFRGSTNLVYELQNSADVTLDVFDMNGRLVSTLADAKQMAGTHSIKFTSNDHNLGSGLYLVRLTVDGAVYFKRIIELR